MASPTNLKIVLHSSENFDAVSFQIELIDTMEDELVVNFSYTDTSNFRINKFFFNLPAFKDEMIWGGGEQYSYLNLREGQNYPIWVKINSKNSIFISRIKR